MADYCQACGLALQAERVHQKSVQWAITCSGGFRSAQRLNLCTTAVPNVTCLQAHLVRVSQETIGV